MALADLLQQNAIIPALKVNSKKQLLQELAAKASKITGLPEREIFDVILQRERLGSTGVTSSSFAIFSTATIPSWEALWAKSGGPARSPMA